MIHRTSILTLLCLISLTTLPLLAQRPYSDGPETSREIERPLQQNAIAHPVLSDRTFGDAGTASAPAPPLSSGDSIPATQDSGTSAPSAQNSSSSSNSGTAAASSAASQGANNSNRYCSAGNKASFGSNDGWAAMPQSCYYTARSATPSPNGVKWTVNSASGLTNALANAACGDIIQITAGTTISGTFTYSKSCSASKYITIETSKMSSLPAEGVRIKPCYAGVSSETGYPSFNCSSTTNVMAKLTSPNNVAVLTLGSGASYLRIIGIEFTRQSGTGVSYSLITSGGNPANHIILDQVYVHGDQKTDETTRGLLVTGMTYVAVVDSFFSDFWCKAYTGACTDAQAISGNSSNNNESVVKVVNNFLVGAAETILFGGSGSGSNQQTDVEIRSNWMYKPLTWYPSSSNYDGVQREVKNLIEIKQCDRCLIEGNVLQNVWSGFSQVGEALAITPREWGVLPCCYDANITFRYNYVTHACQVFQTGSDPLAQGQHNNTFHDIVADDLYYATGGYACNLSYLTQIYTPPNNNGAEVPSNTVMNDITVDHLTLVTPLNAVQGLTTIDGPSSGNPVKVTNVVFTNSIMDAGLYGFHAASGGNYSCTVGNGLTNLTLMNGCWAGYTFDYHVIVRGSNGGGAWPGSHNSLLSDYSSVGFVNYNKGVGGDYRLCTGLGTPSSACTGASPYHNAANDGGDIGANVSLVNKYITGVNTF